MRDTKFLFLASSMISFFSLKRWKLTHTWVGQKLLLQSASATFLKNQKKKKNPLKNAKLLAFSIQTESQGHEKK